MMSDPVREEKRLQKQRVIRRRRIRFVSILLTGFLVAIAYAVMSMTGSTTAQVAEGDFLVEEEPGPESAVAAFGVEHPVFTRLNTPNGETNLVLPVTATDATIIAYHPLNGEGVLPFTPVGARANGGFLTRNIQRIFSAEAPIRYYVFVDSDDQTTAGNTAAVDVGAAAGSPITSPVSGEVTGVSSYLLYGKYEDYEIQIRPAGMGGVTLSLLFVEEPAVKIGETVEAGKTRIGKVRAPQGELGDRLSEYTHDRGAHLHIQASETPLE